MPLRNKDALAFTREILRPRVTRPQMGLALYPEVDGDTRVEVQVTSTTIQLRFSTDVQTITYTDLSIPDLAATINRTAIPVKAVSLSRAILLRAGDLIGPSSYKQIPIEFDVYDRVTDDGVVLRLARYSVKYTRLSNIKLLPPYPDSPGLPWRPVITAGSFTHEFRGRRFHFSIPELGDQAWSLAYGRPFKDVRGVPVTVKKDGVLQLPRFPVHWTEDNMIFFSDGSPLSTSIIEDVDVYNGLVYLKKEFNSTEDLRVDYSYLELNYIYSHIDVNSHFGHSPDLIDKFVVFYMVPTESIVAARTNRTVFHQVGDSLEGTIDSIERLDVDFPIAVIGAYSVQQVIASDRATILDTRVRGGGLKNPDGVQSTVHNLDEVRVNPDSREELRPRVEEVYKDSARFYDIGKYDGEPYPGAAAVVVDIPDHLRTILPEKQVRDKAGKFLAAGVYPVFEFSSRTGEYVPGFAQNISMCHNLNFSGQYTGSYWSTAELDIPNNNVLTGWTTQFEPNVNVVTQEGATVLEVPAGSGFYQSYVKSSPDAILKWKQRSLVSLSGNQVATNQYTSWEQKRFVDTRDVGDGQLTKGYLVAEALHETTQFKDFEIFSPYRTDQTGNILKDIGSELSRIRHRLDLLSTTGSTEGPYFVNSRVSNVQTMLPKPTPPYAGTHLIQAGVFGLGTTPKASTVFSPIAQQAGTGITSSFSPTVGLQLYDPGPSTYGSTETYAFSMGPQLELLGNHIRYRLDTFGTGDSTYQLGLSGLADIISLMSGAYEVPMTGTKWWIVPDYLVSSSTFSAVALGAITGSRRVDNVETDGRMTEILPGLAGIYSALGHISGGSQPSAVSDPIYLQVPEFVLESYSGIVNNYAPQLLTGAPVNTASEYAVANHWYAPHGLYGEVAGTLARDGMLVYEALTSGKARVDAVGHTHTYRGATSGDISYIAGRVEYILDTVMTGFTETLLKGGMLDAHVPRLLEAYALAAYRGDLEATALRADFTGRRMAYSGVYATGIDIMLRSMLTPEGDFQERTIVNQNIGPFSGTPPTEIIGALSAGVLLDDSYMAPLQGAIKTLTGLYSNSGVYPLDANLGSVVAGREVDVFNTLSKTFLRVQGKFTDPGMLDLYRKTK